MRTCEVSKQVAALDGQGSLSERGHILIPERQVGFNWREEGYRGEERHSRCYRIILEVCEPLRLCEL